MVKIEHCSWRGPEFGCQHPWQAAHNALTSYRRSDVVLFCPIKVPVPHIHTFPYFKIKRKLKKIFTHMGACVCTTCVLCPQHPPPSQPSGQNRVSNFLALVWLGTKPVSTKAAASAPNHQASQHKGGLQTKGERAEVLKQFVKEDQCFSKFPGLIISTLYVFWFVFLETRSCCVDQAGFKL